MAATSNGPEVATILAEPDDAIALMVLGHGSGTPIYRPLMVQMAEALANHRIATFRYNYPYSEGMTAYSPDLIDPLDVLLATTRLGEECRRGPVARAPAIPWRTFHEQSGRFGCPDARALARCPGCRVVRLPNAVAQPAGESRRPSPPVPVPMLFVQGGRDEEFCDPREIQPVLDGLGDRATLHVVEDADHFYDPPAGSGSTRSDALSEVASVTAGWMRRQLT